MSLQPGREWETLVARLEVLFAGPGFRVQSPESIRSTRTGNTVKVDVTVRGKVGAQDVLIAFECRDRKDNQGVEWLQQLATRKQDIGASELVAVSRDGFTPDAVREAAAYGIPLRTLSRFDSEDVAKMVLGVRLELQRPRYLANQLDLTKLVYRKFGIDPFGADELPDLTTDVLEEIGRDVNAPAFRDLEEQRPVSLANLVALADWGSAFADGYFSHRRRHTAILAATFSDEWGHDSPRFRRFLREDAGVEVSRLAFVGDVWWDIEEVPLTSVLRYSKTSGTLATVAEFDLRPHGFGHVAQFFFSGDLGPPGPSSDEPEQPAAESSAPKSDILRHEAQER